MRYRLMLLLAAIALGLGIASFFIASPAIGSDGFLHAWFYLLPGIVSYWVSPEANTAFVALAMAVYTAQYLALLSLLVWSAALVKFAVDFVGPKHRRILARRPA